MIETLRDGPSVYVLHVNATAQSGSLREDVLMLAVTDDEHALAGTFTHDEFESVVGGIYGDERDRAIIILSGGNRGFPLAEIECGQAVFLQHINVAQLLTVIAACQPRPD